MAKSRTPRRVTLALESLETRQLLSSSPTNPNGILYSQNFDSTAVAALPAGWSEWSGQANGNSSPFAVFAERTGGRGLAAPANGQTARAWVNAAQPADVTASVDVFADNAVPAQLFVRGSRLNTASPSYYAVSVTRGVQVQLTRVVNGQAQWLGSVASADYVTGKWVQVTLSAVGSSLQVQVYRLDTHQYLNSSGRWQSAQTWALARTDSRVSGPGQVGLASPPHTGSISFDDLLVIDNRPTTPSTNPGTRPPTVHIDTSVSGQTLSAVTTFQVSASDDRGVTRVEYFLDGAKQSTDFSAPYNWTLDPNRVSEGAHTFLVRAWDAANHMAQAQVSFFTRKSGPSVGGLNIPQHYSWIRIAELAYGGTPLTSYEQQLLRKSVDLVVANTSYFQSINQISPGTPKLVYTNASNIYLDLLTDWLHFADAHGFDRESAFLHVTRATRVSGDSGSSQPVNWFWGVYEGGDSAEFNDFTVFAHSPADAVDFGGRSTSMYVGYTDKFREINVNLASPASDGWSGVWEYADQVNSASVPTHWATLQLLSDGTRGLTRSGQILFDPPAGWKPGTVNGSASLFYVRFRTLTDGTAPVANTILGRDYVNAHGTTSGVIPAFDYSADTNHDGYLSNAEYAHRHAGMDARFVYEARLFHGYYGQMRFSTNPSSPQYYAWAIDYSKRLLADTPLGSGLFVDNSSGRLALPDVDVRENVSSYSVDYGAMLNAIGRAIAPHWLMANTSGGQYDADGVIRQNTAYYEEFALRPLASNYTQFEDMANLIAHRQSLKSPAPYAVLDSLPTGGSPTDARTQLATLAYYYMVGDPKKTFLNFYGGYEPSSSWTRHFSQAVNVNVGQPQGSWSQFATGTDPSNRRLTYRVYARNYTNALVLYKPLSYSSSLQMNGSLSGTPTTHWLGGTYRQVRADGTLGPPITSIALHNGEGAILIKA